MNWSINISPDPLKEARGLYFARICLNRDNFTSQESFPLINSSLSICADYRLLFVLKAEFWALKVKCFKYSHKGLTTSEQQRGNT